MRGVIGPVAATLDAAAAAAAAVSGAETTRTFLLGHLVETREAEAAQTRGVLMAFIEVHSASVAAEAVEAAAAAAAAAAAEARSRSSIPESCSSSIIRRDAFRKKEHSALQQR